MHPVSVTAFAKAYDLQCPRYFIWMTDGIPRRRVSLEDTPGGQALAELGQEHERAVVARLVPQGELTVPAYPPGDFDAGCAATKALLGAGAEVIYQGVLQGEIAPGVVVRGIADLIQRRDGAYRVIEIKASRRLKTSQMLQAVVYTALLSRLCPVADPVMVDGLYRQHVPPAEAISGLLQELVTQTIPSWFRSGDSSFHRTSRCVACPFDPCCRDDAIARRHLSLVPGLTPALGRRLAWAGIHDIPSLIAAKIVDPHRLGLDRRILERLQGQALAVSESRIVPTGDAPSPSAAPVELFVEVEPDPTSSLPCRLGLLKRDRVKDMTAYRALLMPDDARDAAQRSRAFLELLVHQATKAAREGRQWAFLYYGPGTVEALAELVAWMGWGDGALEEILLHATDILAVLRRGWFLPVERYTLTSVLEILGIPLAREAAPGFALHVQWRRTRSDELLHRLQAQGEAIASSLMSAWDWVRAHGAG